MQEMALEPNFEKFPAGHAPGPPRSSRIRFGARDSASGANDYYSPIFHHMGLESLETVTRSIKKNQRTKHNNIGFKPIKQICGV